ncbi:cytochrome P450 [Crucibulum laeve]|uniref:Cytochrome P450 n=1 Tax=Crucibulum laeve TaxID=68775 RepID=A0A5C3M0I5_9AGAR|nr:cytochrome P450 [Crucibulum laeve]
MSSTLNSSWVSTDPSWSLYYPFSTTAVAVGLVTIIGLILVSPTVFSKKKNGIKELGGLSILTARPFFSKRFDFLWSNFQKTADTMFKFKVLQHSIVAVRGEEARKVFLDNKNLNFTEGYKLLMGAAPDLKDISVEGYEQDNVTLLNKRIGTLLNRRRLSDVIPTLLDDVNIRMKSWGNEGKFDPFRNIYDLVFQMTVRMASCDELAKNPEAIRNLQKHYWDLEKSSTATALLLPWFPGSAKKQQARATKGLYTIISDYVEKRRSADVPSSDAVDILLAQGLDNADIVGFILAIIFAGVINTGIISCWALVYLSCHPEWKVKIKAEVETMISKHIDTSTSEPLHKLLGAIPISVWEDEMPMIEVVIRETIRMVSGGALLRRNVLEDLTIDGKTISKGDFMAYQTYDVHMNPDIYSDPSRFDPDRYSSGREEDKKETFAYLGWGAGRHPCTGMKVAKLEIKLILALFLAGYDYEVVDKSGNPAKTLPRSDYNDIHAARPIGEPCFIQFKRVVE